MNSPASVHVMISQALDDLERPDAPRFYEAHVEKIIINAMQAFEPLITLEEFHYYSARLRRICQRRKEAA
ncbi:hypothetical protein LZ023_26735 [Pseudomonas silvicola]|nr:hypothetical protein LZ023_26735 [Pseudomonas silvicola]